MKALFQEAFNLNSLWQWYWGGSGSELAHPRFLPLYASMTSKPTDKCSQETLKEIWWGLIKNPYPVQREPPDYFLVSWCLSSQSFFNINQPYWCDKLFCWPTGSDSRVRKSQCSYVLPPHLMKEWPGLVILTPLFSGYLLSTNSVPSTVWGTIAK